MSAVTKSTDPRYAGRTYIDDPEVYKARVAYAEACKSCGDSHKFAWFKAFQKYPRTYSDEVPVQGCANKVETTTTSTGVHVSTFQPAPGTFGTSEDYSTTS